MEVFYKPIVNYLENSRGVVQVVKRIRGYRGGLTRSWHGWNRHVSLVMLAFAMMATIRCRAYKVLAQPKRRLKIPPVRRLSAGSFRKSAA
jgi:hypothetical protein